MKKYIIYLLPLLLLISCSESKESAFNKVKDAETHLYKDGMYNFNDSLTTVTINAYLNFADNFSEDSLTPGYLFLASDLYKAQRKFDEALAIYKRLQTDYPNYAKIPQTVFLEGFVYENDLQKLDLAKERYEAFLVAYPDHVLAKDVQFSLNNLGRPAEDIIREFNLNQAQQDAVDTLNL